MVRRLLVGLLAAGLLLLPAAPAFAQPPVTETTHQKNLVETFVDVVPSCEGGGPLYTITTTSNLVEHTTTFDDGRIHATFTQTGTFVAVPLEDPSLPSYTGSFTVWGGFNVNNQVVNGTFTFSVRGKGSDGSRFTNQSTDHFNERPDGSVNAFFHCH
jgi:opacity protein-like surface antigen